MNMKKDKTTIILIIIIILLASYLVYIKFIKDNYVYHTSSTIPKVVNKIKYDYLDIVLFDNNEAYLMPISKDKIKKLKLKDNLTNRLNTLYDNSNYYDIYIDDNKVKGYKVDNVINIYKIDDIIIFIKKDNTISILNYEDYYNLMYTTLIDNYNDYKDVKSIKDNNIIYLDGSKEEFK